MNAAARRLLGLLLRSFSAVILLAALSGTSFAAETQRQLWITNAYGNDVHVYEVGTWKLLKQFEVGPNPHGISATADGKTVHIAIESFLKPEGELIWIDTATCKITDRIPIGPRPNENECTPDGKWIYIPCDDGQYWVVDGEAKKVVTKIKTGGRPHNTTISPDGKRMYLSPMGGPKRVTIVDVADDHKVLGEIPFDNAVRPPSISKDEKFFYQNIDGVIGFQVADIAQRKVIHTIKDNLQEKDKNTGSRSHGLGVRPDQKEIWSCNVEHQRVSVHELTSGEFKETASIEMPGKVYWVCFTPDSKYCFVSVRSKGQVAVVDCAMKEIVKLLDAGKEPKRTQVIDVPVEQTEDQRSETEDHRQRTVFAMSRSDNATVAAIAVIVIAGLFVLLLLAGVGFALFGLFAVRSAGPPVATSMVPPPTMGTSIPQMAATSEAPPGESGIIIDDEGIAIVGGLPFDDELLRIHLNNLKDAGTTPVLHVSEVCPSERLESIKQLFTEIIGSSPQIDYVYSPRSTAPEEPLPVEGDVVEEAPFESPVP